MSVSGQVQLYNSLAAHAAVLAQQRALKIVNRLAIYFATRDPVWNECIHHCSFKQVPCSQQPDGHSCGLFAISNAVDLVVYHTVAYGSLGNRFSRANFAAIANTSVRSELGIHKDTHFPGLPAYSELRLKQTMPPKPPETTDNADSTTKVTPSHTYSLRAGGFCFAPSSRSLPIFFIFAAKPAWCH